MNWKFTATKMLRPTIYAVAIGTFALTSGASAVSLQNPSPAPKLSSISSNSLLAQYNSRSIRYPIRYYPRQNQNSSGGQNNSQNSSGGQNNSQNSSGGQNNSQNSSGGQNNSQNSSGGQNNSQNSSGGQSDANSASIEQSVFEQINQYRQSQNLSPLTRNAAIDQQARNHSQNMASGKVPFSHQGFEQRVQATGVAYKDAKENVAYNQDKDSATSAVQSWLKSSGHLTNIRSNTNLTGIGVAVNGQGVVYLTQIFIRS
ncbi:putative allergen V5/Tpx-1 [Nostoc sp. NIES-2111]|nr:putative allergen V5/Tpx-1 [Nostoc sp. NIES-2111]